MQELIGPEEFYVLVNRIREGDHLIIRYKTCPDFDTRGTVTLIPPRCKDRKYICKDQICRGDAVILDSGNGEAGDWCLSYSAIKEIEIFNTIYKTVKILWKD